MNLVTLQTKTTASFDDNLKNLVRIIEETPKNSLILAPELCLTGYSYDQLEKASAFSAVAIKALLKCSKQSTIGLTLITKEKNQYFNTFFLFHQEQIIHTQSKVKLFTLNEEELYFSAGDENNIALFEFNGLKIGVLICFELRFIDLWKKLQGADIVLIPAMWGAKRKANFEVLTQALAVANQCFVVASSCANDDCAKGSAIISPFGEVLLDDTKEVLFKEVDLKEIELMRKHLPTGVDV